MRSDRGWFGFAQVSELVPDGQQGPTGEGVSVSTLHQLLTTGLGVQLQLESLQRLQAMLQGHQTWELLTHQVLRGMPSASECMSLPVSLVCPMTQLDFSSYAMGAALCHVAILSIRTPLVLLTWYCQHSCMLQHSCPPLGLISTQPL